MKPNESIKIDLPYCGFYQVNQALKRERRKHEKLMQSAKITEVKKLQTPHNTHDSLAQ